MRWRRAEEKVSEERMVLSLRKIIIVEWLAGLPFSRSTRRFTIVEVSNIVDAVLWKTLTIVGLVTFT